MTTTYRGHARGRDTFLQIGFTAAAGTMTGNGGTAVVDSRFKQPESIVRYHVHADRRLFVRRLEDRAHRLDARDPVRQGTLIWGIEPPAL